MDTFQSPRSMANAVFAEAMKEQQAVTAAATANAAAATTSLHQEASSSTTTTTTNNGATLITTDSNNFFNVSTDQVGKGTGNNASVDSTATNENSSNSLLPSSKRSKNSSSCSDNSNNIDNISGATIVDEVDEFRARMDSLWKNAKTEAELENAFKKTMDLATKQTESVIREGYVPQHWKELQ
jgi:hypothetical protein